MNITRTSESAASYHQKRRVLDLLGNQLLTADERRTYSHQIRHASSSGADTLFVKISATIQDRTTA